MVPVSIAATAVSARAWGLSFGHPTPDSDLDFLVIKRGVQNRRHLAQAIYRALVGIPIPVDIVIVTPEDIETFKDGVATIIGPALREGREVYAA